MKYKPQFDSGSFEVLVNLAACGVAFLVCRTFLENNYISDKIVLKGVSKKTFTMSLCVNYWVYERNFCIVIKIRVSAVE